MDDIEITQELSNLPEGWIVLLETSVEKILDVSLSAMKYLIDEKNYIGIILSASRLHKNLVNLYKQKDIDTKKILFLDCISKSQSLNLEEAGNVLYLEAASDLTNISLAIKGGMEKIKGDRFVFIVSRPLATLIREHRERGENLFRF